MEFEINFYDETHENKFFEVVNQMNKTDCYHLALAYLITLDDVLRSHVREIFDFKNDCINRDAVHHDWNTSSTQKTLRLAFNLWNGCYYDEKIDSSCKLYSVNEIFSCEYAPYYCESLKLRFPENFN